MNDIKLKIIKATISTIAERGIENVSNKLIAGKCGISEGLIYYHFKNKDDLLFNAQYYIVEKEADVLNQAINCDSSYEDNYIKMLTAISSFYIENKEILICYVYFLLAKFKNSTIDRSVLFQICPLSLFLKRGIKDNVIKPISDNDSIMEILSISLFPLCMFLKFHFDKNHIPSGIIINQFIKGMWAAIKK